MSSARLGRGNLTREERATQRLWERRFRGSIFKNDGVGLCGGGEEGVEEHWEEVWGSGRGVGGWGGDAEGGWVFTPAPLTGLEKDIKGDLTSATAWLRKQLYRYLYPRDKELSSFALK